MKEKYVEVNVYFLNIKLYSQFTEDGLLVSFLPLTGPESLWRTLN